MAAPPSTNAYAQTRRISRRPWIVLLGDEDGNAPTESDQADYLIPLGITYSSGGGQLNTARFEYDLARTGERIQDKKTPLRWKRQVEIRLPDSKGRPRGDLLFWGELTSQDLTIASDEKAIVIATTQGYHFGNETNSGVAMGPVHWRSPNPFVEDNDDTGGVITVHYHALSFNPIIDGRIEFNKSNSIHPTDGYYLWIDPDELRTEDQRTINNNTRPAEEWKLTDVIKTVCKLCNPEETWIKNPDLSGLDDSIPIRNLNLKNGSRLPQYLDEILQPIGHGWCLDYSLEATEPEDEDDSPFPEKSVRIRIFRHDVGTEKSLLLQRHGERYDISSTNVKSVQIKTDIAQLSNEIIGRMDLPEHQSSETFPLLADWDDHYDDQAIDDFDKSDPDSYYNMALKGGNKGVLSVYRRFVINEGFDYGPENLVGLTPRPEMGDNGYIWMETLFGEKGFVNRRRTMSDPLEYKDLDKKVRPSYQVYYRKPPEDSDGDPIIDSRIVPVPAEWGWVPLPDRIGVEFTGAKIPEELYDAFKYFQEKYKSHEVTSPACVYIKACVTGDVAREYTAASEGASPNGRRVTTLLDLSDKFKDRKVGNTPPSPVDGDMVDDFDEMKTYVDQIRDREQSAQIDLSVTLHDLQYSYRIGDLLTEVEGRNISFNRNSDSAESKRYPQITGIEWRVQQRETELITTPSELWVDERDTSYFHDKHTRGRP